MPMANCRKLFEHWVNLARLFIVDTAGTSSAARMPMMAMTIMSSMSVKPF